MDGLKSTTPEMSNKSFSSAINLAFHFLHPDPYISHKTGMKGIFSDSIGSTSFGKIEGFLSSIARRNKFFLRPFHSL